MKERSPEEMKAIIDAYIEKKRELGEKPDPAWYDRLLYAGTGLGILRGNLTPVIAGIKGNADMWHGSPAHNLMPNALGEGILNEGLNLRHAGKNLRLNSQLMSNSAQSLMEEILSKKGRKLSKEDERFLTRMIRKINQESGNTAEAFKARGLVGAGLGSGGAAEGFGEMLGTNASAEKILSSELRGMRDSTGKFKSLADRVMDRLPELSKRFNVPEEELRNYFEKNIGRLGKRIYFGTSPESVSYWSGQGNEAGFAAKKLLGDAQKAVSGDMVGAGTGSTKQPSALDHVLPTLKTVGSGAANQVTGGYYGTLKEKLRYGRPETVHRLKDLEALKAHLHSMGEELGKHNVMMQYSIPAGTLDSMADFPIARRVIQSSPGLKDMMGNFMPQADPSKDMSISENVSSKKIKAVDLVDKTTGKLKQRIHLDNYEKSPFRFLGGKGNRIHTLKNIAVPAALSMFGASLLHKAIAPNKNMDRLADTIPDVDNATENKNIAKQAAVNPKVIAALLGVPAVAGLGLAGGSYLTDKALNTQKYHNFPDELKSKFTPSEIENYSNKASNEYAKGLLGTSAANLAATALGTFADRSPGSMGAAVGGYAGHQLLVPTIGASIASAKTDAGALLPLADKIPGLDKFISDHPYAAGGTIGGLMTGALPASLYYIAKKYYPYHAKIMETGLKRKLRRNPISELGQLLGGKGNTIMKHLRSSAKHLPITLAFPAMGLLGAGAGALLTAGIDRAGNKIQKHMDESTRKDA
jgi:hypothetical protein